MAVPLTDDNGSPSRTVRSDAPQKTAQEQLEEHNKGPKAFTGPPKSLDPNPIEHLWEVLEQVRYTEAPPPNIQDPKDPLQTYRCQTAQDTLEVFWPCLNRLELFWQHKLNLHKI